MKQYVRLLFNQSECGSNARVSATVCDKVIDHCIAASFRVIDANEKQKSCYSKVEPCESTNFSHKPFPAQSSAIVAFSD
jgi:hypothetical protein